MSDTPSKRPGLSLQLRVGEAVCLHNTKAVDSEKITLTLEHKTGQSARVRIQAGPFIRVSRPEKAVG